MKIDFFPSDLRGSADYGWLKSKFSYSFGDYYNPTRLGFGALRVLNDDIVLGGFGFDAHPHKNMEIISIPLYGELTHKDSEGNSHTLKVNDVQVMSAGSGITHSEFNNSKESGSFFQIWINPKEKNIAPRYDQKSFKSSEFKNKLCAVASGDIKDKTLYIHQDASVYIGEFDKGKEFSLSIKKGHGAFVMCVDGEIKIETQFLTTRDAVEISAIDTLSGIIKKKSKVLVIIVPLK